MLSVLNKGKPNQSSLRIKKIKKIETEFFDCELKISESNIYIHDDVVVMLIKTIDKIIKECAQLARFVLKKEQISTFVNKILKSLVIHPIIVHVFFKSLSTLSNEIPELKKYQLLIDIVEGWKSFHFKSQKFQLGVS